MAFRLPRRASAGVIAGDEVDVSLKLDTAPREVTVPADFAAALDAYTAARHAFDAMPCSHSLRWVLSVQDAKTDATRRRRIDKVGESLREGCQHGRARARQRPRPTTAVLVIGAPIADDAAPLLCERLWTAACASGAQTIVCDVCALAAVAPARLQLVARRLGCRIRLYRASPELADLLAFLGVATVVGCGRAAAPSGPRPPPALRSPSDLG